MSRAEAFAVLATLAALPLETARRVLAGLTPLEIRALREEWWWQAHGGQIEPDLCDDGSAWRVWAIIAGRGFGKTRAGAEWIWARAREDRRARIALVAASLDEVARVMVEGESGLLSIARTGEEPKWIASRGLFLFPSGARGFAYTAEKPGKLRGPQHHFAWCDELAKWNQADAVWDNLMLGLRLGQKPRTIVTTTPRRVPLMTRVMELKGSVVTRGATAENPHLAVDFREAVTEMYAGTRLGRQELEGLLLEDWPGALWTREMIEEARVPAFLRGAGAGGPLHHASHGPPPRSGEDLMRVVVGVDPPASAGGDACGIVVCGMGAEAVLYVLADLTVSGLRPEGWARRVADAAELWEAQLVVAEKNQGGDMIESVLRGVDCALPVRLVAATRSKAARAEPVALRFETGRAKLAGRFPELEDELCGLAYSGYHGPGGSPDRADAMVWAMSELIKAARGEPRVRLF